MIKPGKYLAKLVDASLTESKKGNAMVALLMEFKDENGNPQKMTWFGATAGGALDITIPTLVRMGFKSDTLADVTQGKEAFNHEADYEIVVAHEPNPEKGGALQARLKWINLPGGSGFRERMSKEDAVKLTVGLNLKAHFMEARANLGVPAVKAVVPVPASLAAPEIEEADLPF